MAGRLEGKVAIVTGSARGTGEATVRRFVAEGARVVVCDVRHELGEEVAADLGDAAIYLPLDVTSETQWSTCVEHTQAHFGTLDILINNAAILHLAPIEQTSLEDWERVVRVNQTGVFLGIRAATPAMREAGGGSIVNVSSIDGIEGMSYVGAYAATKWAIRGLAKCAALELGRDGIRVNTICPAGGNAEMGGEYRRAGGETDSGYLEKRPIQRRGTPEEIAALILYLASDESAFVTGADFAIDGGHSSGTLLPALPRKA